MLNEWRAVAARWFAARDHRACGRRSPSKPKDKSLDVHWPLQTRHIVWLRSLVASEFLVTQWKPSQPTIIVARFPRNKTAPNTRSDSGFIRKRRETPYSIGILKKHTRIVLVKLLSSRVAAQPV